MSSNKPSSPSIMQADAKKSQNDVLSKCRALVESYVNESISLKAFRSEMRQILSLAWSDKASKEILTAEEASLLEEYDYWTFGRPADKGDPGEDPIPLKASWVYGESTEEFGWYDQDAYRLILRSHFLGRDKS